MNIDLEIHKRQSKHGLVQVWKVWQAGGGQGYKVTIDSKSRSNGRTIFSHVSKSRAVNYVSDFVDGSKFGG